MIDGVGGSMFVRTASAARNVALGDSPRETTDGERATTTDGKTLNAEQKARVAELRAVDRNVRAHEAAHQAAGGAAAGGMSLKYVEGPDGRQYAVSGEVRIDLSAGNTPDETIARMEAVQSAATAPADPSPQDMRVAAEARAIEDRARAERRAESPGNGSDSVRSTTVRSATSAYAAADSIGRSNGGGSVASVTA